MIHTSTINTNMLIILQTVLTSAHQHPHKHTATEGQHDLVLEARHKPRKNEYRQQQHKHVGHPVHTPNRVKSQPAV